MSTRETSTADDPVIESFDQLVAPMIGGEKKKPPADWRIGTEHEKARLQKRADHRAPSYGRAMRHPRPAGGP